MHRLTAFLDRLVAVIQPLAEQFGAGGLAVVAFLDSSFLSLPQVADALVIGLTMSHPSRGIYYAMATTLGLAAGCFALYSVGRKGGEAFLRRKFKQHHVERGLDLVQRHGWLTVAVPALMPPPTPFKLFVLLAGVADLKPLTFVMAVILGRGFRFGVEAWLAYTYGDRAMVFVRDNLPTASLVVAGLIVAGAISLMVWRRRQADPVSPE